MKTVAPGVRQKENGKFVATKSIKVKRYYKEFDTQGQAKNWMKNFHPLASPDVKYSREFIPTIPDQSNGRDYSISFGEVYTMYLNGKHKSLSEYKQYKKQKRMDRFLPPLFSVKMCRMTPMVITSLLTSAVNEVKLNGSSFGRRNFDQELKDLKSIFTWYKEVDFTFSSPIATYHKGNGHIGHVERKKKDMSQEQIEVFLSCLPEPYHSFATIQFNLCARVGEVAGLTIRGFDQKERQVKIIETIVWLKGVPTHQYTTKTGADSAPIPLSGECFDILARLNSRRPTGCKYLFQINGEPLRYEWIQKAYNKALKMAGLEEFSGTHFLRHSMGTVARKTMGLDAAQGMLRHTTSRMAEQYARLDVNEKVSEVVLRVEQRFLEIRKRAATIATNDQKTVTDSAV